ncbi:hypothetical protein ISN76_07585 [Dyella halodurans]|uniref:Uncharacterized protein n=1 Tax=Dyella halodurans TaxID=1920171 RepID=A0ABV9C4C2_9GAMM|nr:hypothetical protein [Dyella halodurans]
MYQFICFGYYMSFQRSLTGSGDVADAKGNADWTSFLYFMALSFWLLNVLEPLTGLRTALEQVWQAWWHGRIDPRGGSILFVMPLSYALNYFCLNRRHEAIVARFAQVKLPRYRWFTLVNYLVAMPLILLGGASRVWLLPATGAMAALWLLVEFGFHTWLRGKHIGKQDGVDRS